MTIPADRSHLLTEQRNERTMQLHKASAAECVSLIAEADRAVLDAMDRARPAIVALIEAVEPGFVAGGRLIYVGAGTSGRLGVLDASEAPPTFHVPPGRVVGIIAGGDAALRTSSEGLEDDPAACIPGLDALVLSKDDTVIGIAAGGTTPCVLGAIRHAADQRALAAMITCTPSPPPPGCCHHVVIDTGPEVITGSTRMKAGTATKLALNMISTTLMIRSGRVYENLMVDLRATNDKLRDRGARIISTLTGLGRDEAFSLLGNADGDVKAAIVMARLGVNLQQAVGLLRETDHHLEKIIDQSTAR